MCRVFFLFTMYFSLCVHCTFSCCVCMFVVMMVYLYKAKRLLWLWICVRVCALVYMTSQSNEIVVMFWNGGEKYYKKPIHEQSNLYQPTANTSAQPTPAHKLHHWDVNTRIHMPKSWCMCLCLIPIGITCICNGTPLTRILSNNNELKHTHELNDTNVYNLSNFLCKWESSKKMKQVELL